MDTLNWESLLLGSPKLFPGLILQLLDLLQSSLMSFPFLLLLVRHPWVPGTVFLGKETVDTFTKNSVLGLWGALSKNIRNKHF